MCKIAMVAGVDESKRALTLELLIEMSLLMSKNNNDGLGYAATNESGKIFGERWLNNAEAFDIRETSGSIDGFEQSIVDKYKGFLKTGLPKQKYNSFGTLDLENFTSMTLHARFATSGKEFKNTHPFVSGDTTLIHNGVIRNVSELEFKTSTCDSEGILNAYTKHNVNIKPDMIQKVAHELQGYYACAMYSLDETGARVMDVFKDAQAKLFGAYIGDIDNIVFSTSLQDIETACEILGMNVISTFEVTTGVMIRIDTLTGEPMSSVEFNPTYNGGTEKKVQYLSREYDTRQYLEWSDQRDVSFEQNKKFKKRGKF